MRTDGKFELLAGIPPPREIKVINSIRSRGFLLLFYVRAVEYLEASIIEEFDSNLT